MKDPNVKSAYNLLFQQHTDPGFYAEQDPQTFAPTGVEQIYDSNISCHVFAIRSPTTFASSNLVNNAYLNIATPQLQQVLQLVINPNLAVTQGLRVQNMQAVKALHDQEQVVLHVDDMQLCGGFADDAQVLPEHMWIEDRSNGATYDTFINRGDIAYEPRTGVNGQPFQPGCESTPFAGARIQRAQIDGYTWGQLLAIAASKDAPRDFPAGIANHPAVLKAIECVEEIEANPLPRRPLQLKTRAEETVVDQVLQLQSNVQVPADNLMATMQNNLNAVITTLPAQDLANWESALRKDASYARAARAAANVIADRCLQELHQNPALVFDANEQGRCVIL